MESMAQINARIDGTLKQEGDRALALVGYTPTRAVRALWARARELSDSPEELLRLLDPHTGPGEDEGASERRETAALGGSRLFEEALQAQGVTCPAPSATEQAYAELRERALLERLEERGLAQ